MGNITFSERIKRGRIRNAWSQAELAEKVGTSQMTVSNWETGKTQTKPEQRKMLIGLLGLAKPESGKGAGRVKQVEVAENGPSAFGAWLGRTRLEQKMSVGELATLAGLSAASIYNIESGRIENPREESVKRLEKALKRSVPAETKQEVREDATVEGVGEFYDFDPHNKAEWPDEPGIYVLYDISDRPIYVGQGTSIKKRLIDHEEKFWFKRPIVESGAYIKVGNAQLRRQFETILIRFLKRNAVINKQNVER